MLNVDNARRVAFSFRACKVAFLLLGVDALNHSFLRLEVESHRVAAVRLSAERELWFALDTTLCSRIGSTVGTHKIAVQVHGNVIAVELHILIVHLCRTIQMRNACLCIVNEGIFSRISYRRFDAIRLRFHYTINANGVINCLVVFVNGKLQRVHLRSIYHRFYSIDASFRWLCRLHSGDIGIAGSTDERRKKNRHERRCHCKCDDKRKNEYEKLCFHCLITCKIKQIMG